MSDEIQITLLGPIRATVGGDPVELGPPLQRALLATLAIEVGTVVSVSDLLDRLWGEQPPRTATKSIQKYVSGLRQLLGQGSIVRIGDGYRLALPPESLDVRRLEGELRSAESEPSPARRQERLTAVLRRFSEPLLEGMSLDHLVTERLRIDDMRLGARETALEAALLQGQTEFVIRELLVHTVAHPFREQLWRLLMIALYRAGRHADALRAFHRYRAKLIGELGLDPSPELQAVETQILAHDPALLNGTDPGGDDRPSFGATQADAPIREERRFLTLVLHRRANGGGDGVPTGLDVSDGDHGRPIDIGSPVVGGTTETALLFGIPSTRNDTWQAAAVGLDLAHSGDGLVAIVAGTAEVGEQGSNLTLRGDLLARARELLGPATTGPVGPVVDQAVVDLLADHAEIRQDPAVGSVLVGLTDTADSDPPAPSTVPVVGREAELVRLEGAWRTCVNTGSQAMFLISGEGGIGKTRLLTELKIRLGDDVAFHDIVCGQASQGPFSPVVQLFTSVFGADPALAIDRHLRRSDLPSREVAWLRSHLSLLFEQDEVTVSDRAESLRAWSQLLVIPLRGTGSVVAIDDGHLSSPALRDLVQEILTLVDGTLLVIVATRPEGLDDNWAPVTDHVTMAMPLLPLTPGDRLRLARMLVAETTDAAVVDTLAERSAGNPYFLYELARTVAETDRVDDAPETVRQALTERIDRTGDVARLVLQTAAVADMAMGTETLAMLADLPREAVGVALGRLRRRQLMAPSNDAPSTHQICHPLVAEVALDQVTPSRAMAVHRAMAEWLTAQGDAPALDVLERRMYHAARAEELASARNHVDVAALRQQSGAAAVALGSRLESIDAERCLSTLNHAIERLTAGTTEWARVSTEAGRMAGDLADWATGERLLGDAIETFAALGDHRAEAAARMQLDRVRRNQGHAGTGVELRRAFELVRDDPGPELAMVVSWQAAECAVTGRAEEAKAIAAEHERMVAVHGSANSRIRLAHSVAIARVDSGDESALDDIRWVLDFSLESGLTRHAVSAGNNLGANTYSYRGPDAAVPILEETLDFATRRNQRFQVEFIQLMLAEILIDGGDWDRTIDLARPLLDRDDSQLGLWAHYNTRFVNLWRSSAAEGNGSGVATQSEDSDHDEVLLDRARGTQQPQHYIPWLVLLAQVAARQGNAERVRALLDEFIAAARLGQRWWCSELAGAARAAVAIGALDIAEQLTSQRPVDMVRPELMRRTATTTFMLAAGEVDEVIEPLRSLVTEWTTFGHRLEAALGNRSLAEALDANGDNQGATKARQAANEGLTDLGIPTTSWWAPTIGSMQD